MKTWVIFLRGINVGGHNKLPMAELRASLSGAGFETVKTYIQSGNIILNANKSMTLEDVQTRVAGAIETLPRFGHSCFGFTARVPH